MNIAMHFEIPVTDMTRAIGFYSRVFGITFERAETRIQLRSAIPD
ncbi:hypothetical protein P5G63_22000 [Aeromonas salmonicida]|nr:VOC family protein [Aeromonas salmonicida]MDF8331005.1 hypothetical protein [Aeromonas salmonicida]